MTPQPPRNVFEMWDDGTGQDPARYTINPGKITSRTKYTAGNFRHARPFIASGSKIFAFPVGVEGFERSGTATVGMHKYLGENAVDVHVFHREEGRIQLTGLFPGITSQNVMTECLQILTSVPPEPGLVLVAPGVFETEQYVTAENWQFRHEENDTTHSIAYSISLIRSGTGRKLRDPKGAEAPENPSRRTKPKAKSANTFVVASGAQTFLLIAGVVYHNPDRWQQLVSLNNALVSKVAGQAGYFPSYALRGYRWPIGTKVHY